MPYILSPVIKENFNGMWLEGAPYIKEKIYSIGETPPPVNYDKHIFKSHSLTHIEGSLHTQKNGYPIDYYFKGNYFFGKVSVVRLEGDHFKMVDKDNEIYHWEVTLDQLRKSLEGVIPNKLLLTTDKDYTNEHGFHNPNYVLTLSQEAADWLVTSISFNLYGTTWKSSDYNPGSMNRPIHNTLFKQAAILECINLTNVPAGEYFIVCYPIRIEGASESPVTPVLFTKNEIFNLF